MKRKFKIPIFVFIILLIGGILMLKFIGDKKSTTSNGILIVNGKYTITENITIHYIKNASYSNLPLIKIFKSLGAEIDWIDDNFADITFKGKKYLFNLSEISLIEVGSKINILDSVDGGRREHTVLERELILDSVTIKCATTIMGDMIDFRYDHEKSILYVTERIK